MAMLEHEGVFTLALPDGWTTHSPDGAMHEIVPGDEEGALHISVYERDPTPLRQREAADIVRAFLTRAGIGVETAVTHLDERPDQQRAVARGATTDPATAAQLDLVVMAVLWPHALALCSATAPVGSYVTRRAELLFASITRS